MQYKTIVSAKFLSRPNRFIAYVEINGTETICHVKNTSRCRELLLYGAKVWLEYVPNPNRKTQYDLVAVEKESQMINIDSQAPNKVFEEWLLAGGLGKEILWYGREKQWGNSRFDFCWKEQSGQEFFCEVKGVTLEENGACRFPDAPTQRGVKHIKELIQCKQQGYGAIICFVIQLENAISFTPNKEMHPEFAHILCQAKQQGVTIWAKNCLVTKNSLILDRDVPILL